MKKQALGIVLFILASFAFAAEDGASEGRKATPNCELISANPPRFNPFAYVPTSITDKRFKNRYPKLSYVVTEDGTVKDVKIVKGTGSPDIDADVVKSVLTWKYKPHAGCLVEASLLVTIDIR